MGDDMVVRLPRTPGAAGDVEKEHRRLPRLAPVLPVSVPHPFMAGTARRVLGRLLLDGD
ncbi:hypothetical protein ACF1B0_22355 [Streptomyces anandii]|uniref:hypothetical protein n=1 Tax=Streptomyces anandii TaxID=285454 RepID=UPI0037028A81